MHKALFNINIMQDETGMVYIMADHCGERGMAMEVGLEIMQNLAAAERDNPTQLSVSPVIYSSQTFQ
jgi:hypothetical protein